MRVDKAFADKYDPGPDKLPDFKFLDARVETPRLAVSGNFATFTGWDSTATTEWERIDFVFGGSNRGWCVHFSSPMKRSSVVGFVVIYADDHLSVLV